MPKPAAFGSRVITVGFLSLVMLRGLAVAAEASPDALEEVTVPSPAGPVTLTLSWVQV